MRPARFPILFSPEELGALRATVGTALGQAKAFGNKEYERQLVGLLATIQAGIKEAFGRDI